MGTTAHGGRGSEGRAANGDRPVGAARCRREQHTKGVMPSPPLSIGGRDVFGLGWGGVLALEPFLGGGRGSSQGALSTSPESPVCTFAALSALSTSSLSTATDTSLRSFSFRGALFFSLSRLQCRVLDKPVLLRGTYHGARVADMSHPSPFMTTKRVSHRPAHPPPPDTRARGITATPTL